MYKFSYILDFDCDEETQYSLSEFSHIHLVDGESTEHDNLYNRSAGGLVNTGKSLIFYTFTLCLYSISNSILFFLN